MVAKLTNNPLSIKDQLDLIGIEQICERISAGEDFGSISKTLGVSRGSLSNWLNSDENIISSTHARAESAESWLDKGMACIETALKRDGGVDSTAARAYAQECARRAAIRNPKYRDKTETAITGADGGAIKVQTQTDTEIARQIYMALAIGASKIPNEVGNTDTKTE